jgi:putative ATPase
MSLFAKLEPDDGRSAASQPLAERMRPRTLDEFTGQEALLGPAKPLRTQIERDDIGSMILWGPPGCGKTTLARLIAGNQGCDGRRGAYAAEGTANDCLCG